MWLTIPNPTPTRAATAAYYTNLKNDFVQEYIRRILGDPHISIEEVILKFTKDPEIRDYDREIIEIDAYILGHDFDNKIRAGNADEVDLTQSRYLQTLKNEINIAKKIKDPDDETIFLPKMHTESLLNLSVL